jgi:hypothetical protein
MDGIFARLKPQCANACGYLLPERGGAARRMTVPDDVQLPGLGSIIAGGYLRRNRLPTHRIKSALS